MRRPLLIKVKWTVVWAGAVVCGLAQAPQARAGHWEEIIWPDLNNGVTPAQWAATADGNFTIRGRTPRDFGDTASEDRPWRNKTEARQTPYADNLDGGAASAEATGRVRFLFRWVRDGAQDNPPPFLFVSILVRASARACSDRDRDASRAPVRGETVAASANGAVGTPEDDLRYPPVVWKSSVTYKRELKAVATGGQDFVYGPWIPLSVRATIPGGRIINEDNGSGGTRLKGSVETSLEYESPVANLNFSPNPNGLAVADCSAPNGGGGGSSYSKPLNQYVVENGVPCSIGQSVGVPGLTEELLASADWTLSNPPVALLPRDQPRNALGTSSYSVFPAQYYDEPDPSVHPIRPIFQGLKFNLFNGNTLPEDNTGFGARVLTHHVMGEEIPANIALFYLVNGTNHPTGGPEGWSADAIFPQRIPTPNWIYYYSKAVAAPCTIYYTPGPGHIYGSYPPGASHILMRNAHGVWPTFIYRKVNGELKLVGFETVKGIDTYARVLKHESVHMRCYNAIHNSGSNNLADIDRNGVPDTWESQVGLVVGRNNTVGHSDSEAFARLHEEGITGDLASDWADDGLHWGTAPPNLCQRLVRKDLDGTLVDNFPGSPEAQPAGGTS